MIHLDYVMKRMQKIFKLFFKPRAMLIVYAFEIEKNVNRVVKQKIQTNQKKKKTKRPKTWQCIVRQYLFV